MGFIGISQPGEFREVTRSHVIAWRDDLASRGLSSQTRRHRLAALSSLFEHLYNANTVTHNPVKGVKRPAVESYEGKTPALGDHQARQLLDAPDGVSLKGKRDRAMLATLLHHALRRDELCRLKVKDLKNERRGVAHLKVSGKGGKTRYVPLHPAASGCVLDYLEAAGHLAEDGGHFSAASITHASRGRRRRSRPTRSTRSLGGIRRRWGLRSGCIRCGRRRRPMRSTTRPTLPKFRSGLATRTSRRRGSMSTGRRGRRTVRRSRSRTEGHRSVHLLIPADQGLCRAATTRLKVMLVSSKSSLGGRCVTLPFAGIDGIAKC